ncbi:MAG TPA: YxeA family protein [Bacillota bacterium]|nr:YxeA family protein [Bacillota bacterium]
MKKLTLVLFILCTALVACSSEESLFVKDYYVHVTESYDTERDHDYVYILDGYDENGKEKLITFYVDEPLDIGTVMEVPTQADGYTGDVKEIDMEKVPEKAQESFSKNEE